MALHPLSGPSLNSYPPLPCISGEALGCLFLCVGPARLFLSGHDFSIHRIPIRVVSVRWEVDFYTFLIPLQHTVSLVGSWQGSLEGETQVNIMAAQRSPTPQSSAGPPNMHLSDTRSEKVRIF